MSGHDWQWFGDRTFSQHGEDLILLTIFHCLGIKRPSYLDIGCYDPFVISNTALLYLRGSCGINVDINPDSIARFRRHRPDDINIVAGVGPDRGKLPFYFHSHALSAGSFVRDLIEPHGIEQQIDVDVITLDDIVNEHARGTFPDLLSIDIEGFDLPVLKSFDFSKTAPKVIICEGFCDNRDYHGQIADLLKAAGFFFYVWTGANMTFIHERYRPSIFY